MTLEVVLIVAAALFSVGLYGALSQQVVVMAMMGLELMLNGVVLAAAGFWWFTAPEPSLQVLLVVVLVTLIINVLKIFDLVYVMTGGGPGSSTELLVTYLYAEGFEARRQGYGSAIGVVVLVVVLAFTAVWWRAQRRTEEDL